MLTAEISAATHNNHTMTAATSPNGLKPMTSSFDEFARKKLEALHDGSSHPPSGSEGGEDCAMCGTGNSPDTLLLCARCDRKYPTQATLAARAKKTLDDEIAA